MKKTKQNKRKKKTERWSDGEERKDGRRRGREGRRERRLEGASAGRWRESEMLTCVFSALFPPIFTLGTFEMFCVVKKKKKRQSADCRANVSLVSVAAPASPLII